MKWTFPNIGYVSITVSVLLREWGIDFVPPPPTTDRTVALALKYAPEGACMPFKTVLGNFLEAAELGAEVGFFPGGRGPCSFGWFSTAMNEIFQRHDIAMRVFTLEGGTGDIVEFWERVREESGKGSARLALSGLPGLMALRRIDVLEKELLDIRAGIERPENRRDFDRFEEKTYRKLAAEKNFQKLLKDERRARKLAGTFRENRSDGLCIGIVGDIFSIIDGPSNDRLQRELGDLGVKTRRSLTLSGWFYEKIPILPDAWRLPARKYMKKKIGGFARETVGYTAMWARSKDGVIQVYPLNCMPETAAAAILPQIHKETGLPLLQLVVDECADPEGYRTRVEAFVELIRRKKQHG